MYLGGADTMTKTQFSTITKRLLNEWNVENVDESFKLLELEYTFWPQPNNNSIRIQNFTDVSIHSK